MTPKEQRAYELRLSGRTFKDIARELKYADPSGAYQAYLRAREVVSLENIGEWRLLELERLNAVQNSLWEKAMSAHIPSINALLRVFDLRAKLLGLYSPEKYEVQTHNETSADIDQSIIDLSALIDLGLKYAEENGVETDFKKRQERDGRQEL
jgi:hypothetical protein